MSLYDTTDKNAIKIPDEEFWIPIGATVHGKLAGLVYRHDPILGQLRVAQYEPTNIQSSAQQNWRAVYALAVAAYNDLSDAAKATWRRLAGGKRATGYTLFMQDYLLTHSPATETAVVGTSLVGDSIVD